MPGLVSGKCLFMTAVLAGACGFFPLPAGAQALAPMHSIKFTNSEVLVRYVTDLARRHNIGLPDMQGISRGDLAKIYMELLQRLSALPAQDLSEQDYQDIGFLTREFDDVYNSLHGKLAMTIMRNQQSAPEMNVLPGELQKFEGRFRALENTKISGDLTVFPQSDFGKTVRQSTASNMRGRINVTTKIHEGEPDKRMGDGYVFMRLTAATGRFFPRNKYLLSPTNDINDSVMNPFNSGLNDEQVYNLVDNSNNSNSVRPTLSMEQMYYTQDFHLNKSIKGNYKAGLIYFGNMFDNNNFANSEMLQYANTSFVNSMSWRPNFNAPSAVLQFEKSLLRGKAFIRATGGIMSLTDRDFFGTVGGNYELQLGHKFFKKEGNIRGGFWNYNIRGGSAEPFVTPVDITGTSMLSLLPGGVTTGSRPTGFYMNFDQRIWKDIGLWGRYALNDKQFGQVLLGGLLSSRQSWSFGAEIPARILFKKRQDDVLGIAYGQVSPYSREAVTPATPAFVSLNGNTATTLAQVNNNLAIINPGAHHRDEKILEAYYRYQLNKNVSFSPDMQYIWSPGGTGPQPGVFVLGTRLTVTF